MVSDTGFHHMGRCMLECGFLAEGACGLGAGCSKTNSVGPLLVAKELVL